MGDVWFVWTFEGLLQAAIITILVCILFASVMARWWDDR